MASTTAPRPNGNTLRQKARAEMYRKPETRSLDCRESAFLAIAGAPRLADDELPDESWRLRRGAPPARGGGRPDAGGVAAGLRRPRVPQWAQAVPERKDGRQQQKSGREDRNQRQRRPG